MVGCLVGWLGYLRVCVIVWLTQIILQLENLECGNKNIRVWGSYLLAFICRSPTWSPQIVGPQYKRLTHRRLNEMAGKYHGEWKATVSVTVPKDRQSRRRSVLLEVTL